MDINNINRPPIHPILTKSVDGRLKTNTSKTNTSKFKSGTLSATSESSEDQKTISSHTFCVTALDGLLFHDSTEKENRKKNIQWGNELLDQLDSLRLELLTGNIPQKNLTNLANALKAKRETITDPHLNEIIREIETRVAVELAKMGV